MSRLFHDQALARDQALALAGRRDLEALMAEVRALRDRGPVVTSSRLVVTYSRKVFIPLTQLCRDTCHYCTNIDIEGIP